MKTLVTIILILLLIILFLVVIAGAMYAALIAYHEHRLGKIKSDRYDQYNQDEDVQGLR